MRRGFINGGGGSSAGGMTFTDPSMIAFIQQGASQPGFINGLFSLAEQLVKAGFKDPANTKAKFEDWEKIIKTDEISSLISKLYSVGDYKPGNRGIKFIESDSFLFHGKSNGFNILLKTGKGQNVLQYAFTIGHEINHSITYYFRDQFFETINTTKNSPTARDAFSYFSEYISYSWEGNVGNSNIKNPLDYTFSKHGASNIPDFIRYPEAAINRFKDNKDIIMRAYLKFYNNIK